MAISNIILGENVDFYINGILVACATDFSVTGTRKEIPVTCAGSGDTEQSEVGKAKWTWDTSTLWRQTTNVGTSDITNNITAQEFLDLFQGKTDITVVLKNKNLASGDLIYTGVGKCTNIKFSGAVDSVEKFTASGFFNSFTDTRHTV